MFNKHNITSTGFIAGRPVGVIAFKKNGLRLPGDPARADCWRGIPVLYHLMDAPALEMLQHYNKTTARKVQQSCLELQNSGAIAIVGACGLLALYHRDVTSVVNIPVYLSPLILVNLVRLVIGGRLVGVLTGHSEILNEAHLKNLDIFPEWVVIHGLQKYTSISSWILGDSERIEPCQVRKDLLQAANVLKAKGARAIILECTNLSYYVEDISMSAGLPVFAAHHLVYTAFFNGRLVL